MSTQSKLLILFSFFILFSCSFIDLRPLNIASCPGRAGEILKEGETLSLTFSHSVERHSAETIFRLSGPSGCIDGDFFWEGNTMYFTPLSPLDPGYQYALSFQGRIASDNGTFYDKDFLLPFYYITDSSPPLLIQTFPSKAGLVDVHQPLILTFNTSMNTQVVEDSFSLQPGTKTDFQWNSGNSAVTIIPEDQWVNLQYYTWRISSDAADSQDIRIPREYSGSFLVQLDAEAPALISSHPAHEKDDGGFDVLDIMTLDDLSFGDHIALVFNEEISFETLKQYFKIQPRLDGYILSLNPYTAMYYIMENIPPETDYCITIRSGLEDSSGNPTAEDIEVSFTPDIPGLDIMKISINHAGGTYDILPNDFNNPNPVTIIDFRYYGTSPDYFIYISIELSQGFTPVEAAARQSFENSVSLIPVFPPGTVVPDEYITSWMSNTVLQFQFRDVITSTATQPVYYRVRIKGGDSVAANNEGAYLIESIDCSFQGAQE